ncbi:MAG: universal stress protein [Deltaproteobacteria bacterium CG_4_8_14_3_um_filter_51_11]|nr:universal stress protein [bacterium]OIP38302.1 MAG: universal stress protein [Desulfobacteraceae bacterium CG2_30_51_40]PIP47222.1 MAG: universal stress protein [Deltaproteobacteria bacterium CG23_combo_of_CG06-09_8_20_14_all_51_20]PIW00521.1 MAG: universal stress protein [Deltaproteobacteria bacterium CG17_big_fil_post_rev_8_21_14_2_50_51_6]PIX20528.1 MAG: universal stress protein [Deltaproteobacteria bacterium CG_4_8_14_3_um_filter_51_11]PIY26578.1 MAG: universal stress protein [Deltaprot
MATKKILWPTDLSENSQKALPVVSSLAQAYGAEVHVLYVLEDIGPFGAWYGDFELSQIEALSRVHREKAEERLDDICRSNLSGCPLYIRHTAAGDPASEILKAIDKEKPDFVIIARQGKTGRFDSGSVAEKVFRHSSIPVIAVPV